MKAFEHMLIPVGINTRGCSQIPMCLGDGVLGFFNHCQTLSACFRIMPLKQKSSICHFQDILFKLWTRIIGIFFFKSEMK